MLLLYLIQEVVRGSCFFYINVIIFLTEQGFDEYMNLVLDDAEEVNVKKKSKKALGMSSFPLICCCLLYT